MSQMSVEQFANELGIHPSVLLERLQAAGVSRQLTADSLTTENDKTQLLDYLRKIHGAKDEKNKIGLPRGQIFKNKSSDSTGKPRSIQVEVRKKRTKQFSGIIRTRRVGIRLEEPLCDMAAEDGTCTGCSQVSPRKIMNTNQGALALCPKCTRKAMQCYKKLAASKHLLPEKRRSSKRRKPFLRVLQGGAPGLGKRSS